MEQYVKPIVVWTIKKKKMEEITTNLTFLSKQDSKEFDDFLNSVPSLIHSSFFHAFEEFMDGDIFRMVPEQIVKCILGIRTLVQDQHLGHHLFHHSIGYKLVQLSEFRMIDIGRFIVTQFLNQQHNYIFSVYNGDTKKTREMFMSCWDSLLVIRVLCQMVNNEEELKKSGFGEFVQPVDYARVAYDMRVLKEILPEEKLREYISKYSKGYGYCESAIRCAELKQLTLHSLESLSREGQKEIWKIRHDALSRIRCNVLRYYYYFLYVLVTARNYEAKDFDAIIMKLGAEFF